MGIPIGSVECSTDLAKPLHVFFPVSVHANIGFGGCGYLEAARYLRVDFGVNENFIDSDRLFELNKNVDWTPNKSIGDESLVV